MPLYIAIEHEMVAANDEFATSGAALATAEEIGRARAAVAGQGTLHGSAHDTELALVRRRRVTDAVEETIPHATGTNVAVMAIPFGSA